MHSDIFFGVGKKRELELRSNQARSPLYQYSVQGSGPAHKKYILHEHVCRGRKTKQQK